MPHFRTFDPPRFSLQEIELQEGSSLRSLIEDALSTPTLSEPLAEVASLFHRPPRPDPSFEVELPWLPTIGIRPQTPPDLDVTAAVPEPTAALCFAVGLVAVARRFRRRRG